MSAEVATREREHAVGGDLRSAWATGRPVILRLTAHAGGRSVSGIVACVSPTDAYVLVDDDQDAAADPLHVPLADVEEVTRPHFHEAARWHPRARPGSVLQEQIPGQQFIGEGEVPPVSRSARRAVERAARSLLPGDLLAVLAALDQETLGAPSGRRRRVAPAEDVAESVGRSARWTRRRLLLLERQRYVQSVKGRHGRALWHVAPE